MREIAITNLMEIKYGAEEANFLPLFDLHGPFMYMYTVLSLSSTFA